MEFCSYIHGWSGGRKEHTDLLWIGDKMNTKTILGGGRNEHTKLRWMGDEMNTKIYVGWGTKLTQKTLDKR